MRSILIIGATSAIAQATARQLASTEARFMLWGRSRSKLDIIAADLRARRAVRVDVEAFDFDDFSQHRPAFERAVASLSELDMALVCHGTLADQIACQKDFVIAEREIRSSFLSAMSFLTLLANYFEQRRRGCLVAISSVAGDRGRKSNYVYGTAKAALTTFLQGQRNRLASKRVNVITVKPGLIDTPMTAHMRKGVLFASPEAVARDIVRGVEKGKDVVYSPWFWRWIMLVIKLLPESVFKKLNL